MCAPKCRSVHLSAWLTAVSPSAETDLDADLADLIQLRKKQDKTVSWTSLSLSLQGPFSNELVFCCSIKERVNGHIKKTTGDERRNSYSPLWLTDRQQLHLAAFFSLSDNSFFVTVTIHKGQFSLFKCFHFLSRVKNVRRSGRHGFFEKRLSL